MKVNKTERAEQLARLREWLKPGDTLHTVLRHVSRSGMQREIGLVIVTPNGDTLHPNYAASIVLGMRQGKRDGVIVGGCGMDMGFHLVYNLSHAMFPKGFGVMGERTETKQGQNFGRVYRKRPKSEAEAARMVAAGWKFQGRNGDASGWDRNGGYALNHRWL